MALGLSSLPFLGAPLAQPGRGARERGCVTNVSIEDYLSGAVVYRKGLTFDKVQFLVAGKAKEAPPEKAMGKGIGCKGKAKASGKGLFGQDSGATIPLWFGDAHGKVICVLATPAQAAEHGEDLAPGVLKILTRVDVHDRFPKTLKWGAETALVMESQAQETVQVFPYEKYTVYEQHYASLSFVESDECSVGMVVSLAVRVVDLEEAWVRDRAEPHAKVMLVDADRAHIGPIHLWDFLPSDLQVDGIYMFRGLKVGVRRVYNETAQQWQRSPSGGKVLECSAFTAVETVEHESVRCFFH